MPPRSTSSSGPPGWKASASSGTGDNNAGSVLSCSRSAVHRHVIQRLRVYRRLHSSLNAYGIHLEMGAYSCSELVKAGVPAVKPVADDGRSARCPIADSEGQFDPIWLAFSLA